MSLRIGKFLAAFLLILGASGKVLPDAPLLPPEESEAKLEKRIRIEVRPIRKARLQIKLARLQLRKSAKSYGELRMKEGRKYLKDYIEVVELAHATLQKSGRDPARSPQGFKDLEIALRQHIRVMEDLKRRVPYDERQGVQAAIDRVDEIREQVLESMFATEEIDFDRGTDVPAEPGRANFAVHQVAAVWISLPATDRRLKKWPPAGASRFVQLDPAELGEAEVDRIRDAQEASERIQVYLQLAAARLDKFEEFRTETGRRMPGKGYYLDSLLKTYNDLYDELKAWIEYQYDKNRDMRGGLRSLLKKGPVHLERLRRAQRNRDPFTIDFTETLQYAIENVEDTLQGGAQALRVQQEQFKDSDENKKGKKKRSKRRNNKRRE